MIKKIEITDYGVDFGCGRVWTEFDDGRPDTDAQEHGFNSLSDALEWVKEVTAEEEPDVELQLEERDHGNLAYCITKKSRFDTAFADFLWCIKVRHRDINRPSITGILIEPTKIIATDGHRLHIIVNHYPFYPPW